MRILVLDGNLRSSLAAVRSLGRTGVCVVVGDSGPNPLAAASKYCSRSVEYPSPWSRTREFLEWMGRESQRLDITHILPMSDVTAHLAPLMRRCVPPRIAVMSPDSVLEVQDKRAVLRIAETLGIPTPGWTDSCDPEELRTFARQAGYPVVMKPRFSKLYSEGTWRHGRVEYVWNDKELLEKRDRCHRQVPHPLLQERVQGYGLGVFLLLWDGEVKASFCHRRIREKPPWGGISVLSQSVAMDAALLDSSVALLKTLGMQGPAMVEYKVDGEGVPRLMEVNARFWGSLQLAVDAGVDFPALYLQCFTGRSLASRPAYKVGVRSRWLLGDLDALVTSIRGSAPEMALVESRSSTAKVLMDFCNFGSASTRSDVVMWSDPLPAWRELAEYVRTNSRAFLKRR